MGLLDVISRGRRGIGAQRNTQIRSAVIETLESRQLLSGVAFAETVAPSDSAAFSADAEFAALAQTPTTATVNSSSLSAAYGQSLTFTAIINSATGIPTGLVNFRAGSTIIGSSYLDEAGRATFTTSSLPAGTHSITAQYTGEGSWGMAISPAIEQVVQKATTSTAIATIDNPVHYGTALTFTAILSAAGGAPTGVVTFRDGQAVLGAAVLDNTGQARLNVAYLGAGDHAVVADYAGDANYLPSASPALAQQVTAVDSTLALTSSVNPAGFGQSVTLTATISSDGPATGSVTFKSGATVLGTAAVGANGVATFSTTAFPLGEHTLTAEYAGDANVGPSASGSLVQAVVPASTSTAAGSTGQRIAGKPITLVATVTSSGGIPAGDVVFRDGDAVLGSAPLNAAGKASLILSSLKAGTHTIAAAYAGSDTHTASSGTFVLAVAPPDNIIPTTQVKAPKVIARSAKPYTFTVTYRDAGKVKASTIANQDLLVVGPRGYQQKVRLVGKTSNADATVITATYSIIPPSKRWMPAANGNYAIWTRTGQIRDVAGNAIPVRKIGYFVVQVA